MKFELEISKKQIYKLFILIASNELHNFIRRKTILKMNSRSFIFLFLLLAKLANGMLPTRKKYYVQEGNDMIMRLCATVYEHGITNGKSMNVSSRPIFLKFLEFLKFFEIFRFFVEFFDFLFFCPIFWELYT